MSRIRHPLSNQDISEQLSSLLNTYNNLSFRRNFSDVMEGKVDYVVETHGKYVLAACGCERLNYQVSEIKHLVVRPDWRGKGLGHFVAKKCLEGVVTPLVYATVKRDNDPSVAIFRSLGFEESATYHNNDHDVVMLVRANPKWTPKPDWKSVSSHEAAPLGTEALSLPK